MSHWEALGQASTWRTPAYVFDALGCRFDMDVAADPLGGHVPADRFLDYGGLERAWEGFVWMNPPFGPRNGLKPWLDRFIGHGCGIALVPDRTSAPWFQAAARFVDLVLFVAPKIKFERPDGSLGKWPSTGTALFACSELGRHALASAAHRGLGLLMVPLK